MFPIKVCHYWTGFAIFCFIFNVALGLWLNKPIILSNEVSGDFHFVEPGLIYSGRGQDAVDVYKNDDQFFALPKGESPESFMDSSQLVTLSEKVIYRKAGKESFSASYVKSFSVSRITIVLLVLNLFGFIAYTYLFSFFGAPEGGQSIKRKFENI